MPHRKIGRNVHGSCYKIMPTCGGAHKSEISFSIVRKMKLSHDGNLYNSIIVLVRGMYTCLSRFANYYST